MSFSGGMALEERTFLKRIDWNFALFILALNVVGLINLYSATHGAQSTGMNRLFVSQVFWLTGGWLMYFVITFIDYQVILRFAWVIYGLNLMALIAVIFVGKVALGAQRWLDLGFFSYQPSETMKVALVLVFAKYFSQKSYPDGMGLKDLIIPGLIIGVPFAITVEQPDLGTGMMLLIIGSSVLLFIRIKPKILFAAGVAALIALPIAWTWGLRDYQKNRVLTFVYPGRDPRGTGYNSIQSKIAVGSGKVIGKGFRKGTQSQLEFLPERHTDFIYSVLSEEHGFIGSVTTIGLFGILFLFGTRIASQARDKAGSLLAVGVIALLFWHMFINIGMVVGLLPIVGIPLPLLSYGGSSMLTTMTAMGIVSSVAYRKFLF